MKKLVIAATIMAGLGVAGCQYKSDRVDYKIPFAKQELEELFSGKTYHLTNGAFYFEKDGKLTALWDGRTEETTWSATNDSEICYDLEMFGGEECLGLFKRGKHGLVQVVEGRERNKKFSDIEDGKAF